MAGKDPRYVKVARALLREIMADRHPVGTLLPNEATLCERFQVSRTTVREALRQLSDQGVVEKLHGVGTVVRTASPRSNYAVFAGYTDLVQYGRASKLFVIDRTEIALSYPNSLEFGCKEGENWHRIRGLRVDDTDPDRPVSFLQVFIPERYGDVANEHPDDDTPYHQRIQDRYGVTLQGIEQEIGAIAIDNEDEVRLLKVPAASPGLRVLRRFYGEGRKLIQCTLNTHPAGRFVYSFNLNRAKS